MDKKLFAAILAVVALSSSIGGVYAGSVLARGPPGSAGTNGANGSNGSNGLSGINGTNGKNGVNGTAGRNGTNGTTTLVYLPSLPGTGLTKITNSTQYFVLLAVNATSLNSMVIRVSPFTNGFGVIALSTVTVSNSTGYPTETVSSTLNVNAFSMPIALTFAATSLLFLPNQTYDITMSGGNCLGSASSQYSFTLT